MLTFKHTDTLFIGENSEFPAAMSVYFTVSYTSDVVIPSGIMSMRDESQVNVFFLSAAGKQCQLCL